VWGGAVVGVAFMALFTSLWVALGYGSGVNAFSGWINWWVGGTAIVAALLAGWLAGWLSGSRGLASGGVHGLTTWGLLVIAAGLAGLPGTAVARVSSSILWTAFWAVLIGLGAAVLGGIFGAGTNSAVDESHRDAERWEGERWEGERRDGGRRDGTVVAGHNGNGYHVARVEEVIVLEEPGGTRELHISAHR
jgi:hypothetical protein